MAHRACLFGELRASSEPRRRGGRRAGAGAPKGNLNGLKTGRHSKVYKQLAEAPKAILPGEGSSINVSKPANRCRLRGWCLSVACSLRPHNLRLSRISG